MLNLSVCYCPCVTGFSKLASVPSGGAVAVSSAAAPAAGVAAAAPAGEFSLSHVSFLSLSFADMRF